MAGVSGTTGVMQAFSQQAIDEFRLKNQSHVTRDPGKLYITKHSSERIFGVKAK
jgi:hypothetical protein